jgi:hypothetical protein
MIIQELAEHGAGVDAHAIPKETVRKEGAETPRGSTASLITLRLSVSVIVARCSLS